MKKHKKIPDNYVTAFSDIVKIINQRSLGQIVFDGFPIRTKVGQQIVSTVWAIDFEEFETAIANVEDPFWVVVDTYDSEDEAKEGHEKWCKLAETQTEFVEVR